MRLYLPSERDQATTPLPFESEPIWGSAAFCPETDSVWTVLNEPDNVRRRTWIRKQHFAVGLVPSKRPQVKTALPVESNAIWGASAVCPAAECSSVVPSTPAA